MRNRYILQRSHRKTISLSVDVDSNIVVKAPLYASLVDIESFVQKNETWITQQQSEQLIKKQQLKRFLQGELYYYLGRAYPLHYERVAHQPIQLRQEAFIIKARFQVCAKELFESWYRGKALPLFQERAERIASQHCLTFKTLTLSNAKTQWGNCNARGEIKIHWRLVMAPLEVIDYVIAHELAHTREMNHSRRFWGCVARMMPDYKRQKKWLDTNHHIMAWT